MKKFYTYFMAALAVVFVFVACNNNPNEPDQPGDNPNDTIVTPGDTIPENPGDTTVTPGDENLILGSWIVDSSFVQIAALNMTEDLEMTGAFLSFYQDGTVSMTMDGETDAFTYSVEGDQLILTIVEDGETITQAFTILTLTETSLVLTAQETEQGMTAEVFMYLHRVSPM